MIPSTMKAAVLARFGSPDNITIKEVPTPTIKPNQVLVRIHATTVNSGDARIRGKNVPRGYGLMVGLVFGFGKPRFPIMGMDYAGEVVATGANVRKFAVGDRVYGGTGITLGAHAEYVAVKETSGMIKLPDDINYETAVSLPFGSMTARFFLEKRGKLQRGETILINGASGAVGIAMTQLAKHIGAHVTAVCSEANHDMMRTLGADEVIDYHTTDIAKLDKQFNVIADCVGNAPYARMRDRLKKEGRLLTVVSTMGEALAAPIQSCFTPHKVLGGTADAKPEDLDWFLKMHKQGAMTAMVDTTFQFPDIVAAHKLVDGGHKKGMVVVRMPNSNTATNGRATAA